jgi:hypothetical protein
MVMVMMMGFVVVVMMAVVMAVVMVVSKDGHENDLAVLVDVPMVDMVMADHFLVEVERLRLGRKADDERQRGDRG